ncbi:hypothetical protein CASFOL_006422 [Castilleja foliolosa]|uniref:START domain-containing protein n=1 Tax=Castilleja foliolosa TaxID=1961234 RepID=A0ABD3EA89_9LAMI
MLTTHITTFELNHQPEADNPEMSRMVADNNRSLFALAEETKKEFLLKANGNAINWNRVPGLELNIQGVIGTVCVPSGCIGVAARACANIPFEPVQTMELLKDRPSWSRFCHSMNVFAEYSADNGGIIELICTKYYVPTTMALARDFCTLRYSSDLDDGSLVVCEKSISDFDDDPSSLSALEFVRARMLASGYMICPAEVGSTIHLVQHFDFEASSIPEAVRPLYESSEHLAQMTVVSALRYVEHVYNETNGKLKYVCHEHPALLRSFSQKLSRGFNNAVSGFSEDGWALMNDNSSCNDVFMCNKRTTSFGAYSNCDSILCVKSSILLQNVCRVGLLKLIKERRSAWMGFNFQKYMVASRPTSLSFPGLDISHISEFPVLLGYTNHDDGVLEITRFDRRLFNYYRHDLYHLQVTNGMKDKGVGACSELIFAPIEGALPNVAVQLCCGFRIFSLGSNTASASHQHSMLVLAFQFPYETKHLGEIEAVVRLYVQHVISSVKNLYLEVMIPSVPSSSVVTHEPTLENLANLISNSYRLKLGVEMLGFSHWDPYSAFELVHHHQDAILCYAFMPSAPECTYANLAAHTMLQTTPEDLSMLTVDRVFGGSNFSLVFVFPILMELGYAFIPSGYTTSATNLVVSYKQVVVWRVQASDNWFDGLALAFVDWSFI